MLLDALWRPALPALGSVRWLDLAAVACLVCGVDWRGLLAGEDSGTPIDGLLLGALAIGCAQALASAQQAGSSAWFAQLVAGCGVYFGLTRALRRSPRAIEAVWRALAAVAIALGLHAIWAVTGGLAVLARQDALADVRWAGSHVLAKLLAFLALALAGRALERQASPYWRLAALLAAAGTALHLAVGGLGLGAESLARMDDPIFFSTLSVTLMLVVAITREAWALARVRPHEALRWRMLAVASALVGVGGALGQASGGEGVRVLVGLAGAAVMTVRALPAAPAAVVPLPLPQPEVAAPDESAGRGELSRAA